MKEYKHVSLRKNIIDNINDAARDRWRVVAYSASNFLGSTLKYDIIFERDLESSKSTDFTVEYKIVTKQGNIVEQINDYTLKGYKLVSFSNNTILGSSLNYDLLFERTIKIL
ncbi:MAG: hypothetical protein NUK62_06640 [Tenericutes bacterium]|nr:hypothetical protein [Mycoplasmatota bacterium]